MICFDNRHDSVCGVRLPLLGMVLTMPLILLNHAICAYGSKWSPPSLHSACFGYGGGGWRNSEEFISTHKNKLCVSDQQPDPVCIHTTCYVRAPALIMIAHPNGLNGFFSSEVNDGAEPGSQFPGGSLWVLLCWKRINSRGRGRATWKQKSSSCDKCHSHLHNWSSLCWWWP